MGDLRMMLTRLFRPITWIIWSSFYLPTTILRLLLNHQFSTLFSASKFQDVWFATMWEVYGPGVKAFVSPTVKPLISLAHGVVLEVGPGSGEWLNLFDASRITKIYGVEPNRDHHVLLRQRIIEAGLSDIYHIIPVGVEDLDGKGLYGGEQKEGGWIQKGEVDCIVTIQCLCSIPEPKGKIQGLYAYLKKGGMWIVFEHIVTKQGGWVKLYQSLVDIIYPVFMGGCSITRDTEKWLREAGSWKKIELEAPAGQPYYQPIPFILGVLTK